MFKFLKNKIKEFIPKFKRKADESAEEELLEKEEIAEKIKKEEPDKKKEKPIEEESIKEEVKREEEKRIEEKAKKEEIKEKVEKKEKVEASEKVEKKGILKKIKEKITTKKISSEKFDELFWELELALLENNASVEVIEKIKEDLKKEIADKPISRKEIDGIILRSLKNSIKNLIILQEKKLEETCREKKPYTICFFGVNGGGKTTTIAKIAHILKKKDFSVVLGAADTFRAAAIQQLEHHANNLNIKIIKHDYGSDAAAVAYDAIKHAEAKGKDVVLIDTAGRLHSNHNLLEEMKKIVRVANPDLKIFVGESITGNDCVEQAKKFDEAIGIDGIILTKADIDEKGGAILSVSHVTGKPILYFGTGQSYDDLEKPDRDKMLRSLGLE